MQAFLPLTLIENLLCASLCSRGWTHEAVLARTGQIWQQRMLVTFYTKEARMSQSIDHVTDQDGVSKSEGLNLPVETSDGQSQVRGRLKSLANHPPSWLSSPELFLLPPAL